MLEKFKRGRKTTAMIGGAIAVGLALGVATVHERRENDAEQDREAAVIAAEIDQVKIELAINGVEQVHEALESGRAKAYTSRADSGGTFTVVKRSLADLLEDNADAYYYAPSDEVMLALSDIEDGGISSQDWRDSIAIRIDENRTRIPQEGEELVGAIAFSTRPNKADTIALQGLIVADQYRTDTPTQPRDLVSQINVGDGDITNMLSD
jgi:hypothetical protein